MKKSWRLIVSMALASGLGIALHAQTPTTSTQKDPTAPGKITVTGCVERADQVTPSSTAATTVDSLSFVLMNATKGSAVDSRPETRGTSGTATPEKGSMYRLDADLAKLNPHVGHKVELTGTLDTAGAPTAANPAPPSAANAPTLKVDTVKMLAETCAR